MFRSLLLSGSSFSAVSTLSEKSFEAFQSSDEIADYKISLLNLLIRQRIRQKEKFGNGFDGSILVTCLFDKINNFIPILVENLRQVSDNLLRLRSITFRNENRKPKSSGLGR